MALRVHTLLVRVAVVPVVNTAIDRLADRHAQADGEQLGDREIDVDLLRPEQRDGTCAQHGNPARLIDEIKEFCEACGVRRLQVP